MKKTEIVFVLDRSTSMHSIAQKAVDGFNAFLKEQQKNPKGKRLTLLQFDNKLEYIYKSKKISKCIPLVNGETYVIQGWTALLDAIGTAVHSVWNAKNVILAVYTDGYENSSQEFTTKNIKKILKRATKKGWETIFLAAEVDTIYFTHTLNINPNKVARVRKGDFLNTMTTVSSYTSDYAISASPSANMLQADIDDDVSKESGGGNSNKVRAVKINNPDVTPTNTANATA